MWLYRIKVLIKFFYSSVLSSFSYGNTDKLHTWVQKTNVRTRKQKKRKKAMTKINESKSDAMDSCNTGPHITIYRTHFRDNTLIE